VVREIENWGGVGAQNKADVCQEFGLLNSMIQIIWEKKPKLLVCLNRAGQE